MAFSLDGAVRLILHAPTALFPIALGLAGLGAALRTAAGAHDVAGLGHVGTAVMIVASGVLAFDAVVYLIKLMRTRNEVAEDLVVAARANLLAPGFMAAMVLAGALASASPLGGPLWLAATLGHLVLLLRFVGQWLTRDYSAEELNPTWFLPAAGIMTSSLTWPGYGPIAIPIFTLSVGAMLWLMLLPLVFRRLVFEPALEPRIRPTLFIVAAPFGLLANALITLMPDISMVAPAAVACGGLFFILVLTLHARFLGAAGVTLSWWATTFPVATVATAFLRTSPSLGPIALATGTALVTLALLTTSLAAAATIRAAWRTCQQTVADTRTEVAAMQGQRTV